MKLWSTLDLKLVIPSITEGSASQAACLWKAGERFWHPHWALQGSACFQSGKQKPFRQPLWRPCKNLWRPPPDAEGTLASVLCVIQQSTGKKQLLSSNNMQKSSHLLATHSSQTGSISLPDLLSSCFEYQRPSCRGAATDKAVRTVYNLDGLLPARRLGLQEEVNRAGLWIQRCGTKLEKFQALMTLKETNRDCFFGLLLQNIDTLLPIIYTPTGMKSYTLFYSSLIPGLQIQESLHAHDEESDQKGSRMNDALIQ